MTVDEAAKKIWEYMLMHHELKKADLIFVLGSRDVRTAEYAAKLYKEGWAPLIVFSGSGTIHADKPGREQFAGTTEADLFADIAIKNGVPLSAILVENQSQNTGDNYEFTSRLLRNRGVQPKRIIAVQKPFMERRVYATGKIHWPDVDLIVTSPPISYEENPTIYITKDQMIHALVGDLQRIREYPKRGFQIEMNIPSEVWSAYEFLVAKGYTERLIK